MKLADAYDIASSKLKDLSEQEEGPANSIQRLNNPGAHLGPCWWNAFIVEFLHESLPIQAPLGKCVAHSG